MLANGVIKCTPNLKGARAPFLHRFKTVEIMQQITVAVYNPIVQADRLAAVRAWLTRYLRLAVMFPATLGF